MAARAFVLLLLVVCCCTSVVLGKDEKFTGTEVGVEFVGTYVLSVCVFLVLCACVSVLFLVGARNVNDGCVCALARAGQSGQIKLFATTNQQKWIKIQWDKVQETTAAGVVVKTGPTFPSEDFGKCVSEYSCVVLSTINMSLI